MFQWGWHMSRSVVFPMKFPSKVYTVLQIFQSTGSTSNFYHGMFYVQNLTTSGYNPSDTGATSNNFYALGI